MKRRQFVTTALLAGSAAGCAGLQTNDSPTESSDTADTPNGDSTHTMTDEHATGVQRQIELTNVEIPPEDVPVSIGVNIQESKVTADQAAKIEVGYVITEAIQLGGGPEVPVGQTLSDVDTPGLVLLPVQEARQFQRVNDEMWKPDRPKDKEWTFFASATQKDVAAQTLLTSELEVWADHRYNGYFEPSEYSFSHYFLVNGKRFDWSFTITVK